MEELDKKDFDAVVDLVIAEEIIIEDYEKDYELDYEKFVKTLSESYQINIPGYMPESQFIRKKKGKYYIRKDCTEEAISLIFYTYAADLFKNDSRKLEGYNQLFSKLLIDFHLILKEERDWRVGVQLLTCFEANLIERIEFQKELSLLLNGILNETIKQGDDITEYVKVSEPFKNTLIGYIMGKFYTYMNGVYYLNEVDLFSAEFGMLYYCGMYFTVAMNQAEFLCRACRYYKIRQ